MKSRLEQAISELRSRQTSLEGELERVVERRQVSGEKLDTLKASVKTGRAELDKADKARRSLM